MLTVVKEPKENALAVRLIGTIEEDVNFAQLIGEVPGELHVNTKEVSRISSHGVRQWVRYFDDLASRGVRIKHVACSVAVVQQLSLIVNFISDPSGIESICVPYLCAQCKGQFVSVIRVKHLLKIHEKIPSAACPKCGKGEAIFDDLESEYFNFLRRLKP
ncbi:MAG: hypothetical protein NDJ90_16040 [Oligoflexia bacterium]|nr:hypothetical protein [Oligoflexia bacterium]